MTVFIRTLINREIWLLEKGGGISNNYILYNHDLRKKVQLNKQYEINLLFSDNRFITLYSEIIEVTLEDLKKK